MEVFSIEYLQHISQFCSLKLLVTLIAMTGTLFFINKWKKGGWCYSTALLSGKTVIVTGSNTGIGKEAARDFYKRGARVILACRDLSRANQAAGDIKSTPCNQSVKGEVVVHHLDLASFSSVKNFAKKILTTESRIDVLVNNAGIIQGKKITTDGFDMTFQTNYLGHFLLTNLLLNKMKKSVPSRIVNVTSDAHVFGKMHWNDLNLNEMEAYNGFQAYCQSKLANVLFTKELECRLQGTGVNVYAVHPGIVQTSLDRYISEWFKGVCATMLCFAVFPLLKPFLKTPTLGAQTIIHCAVSDEVSNQTGLYYSNCCEKKQSKSAMDKENAKKLWKTSTEMVKLCDALSEFNEINNF